MGVGGAGRRDGVAGRVVFLLLKRRDGGGERIRDGPGGRYAARKVTYQEFASYWPYQNSADQPYTVCLNNIPKFVVSTTLQEPLEWNNSTLIKDNVAEEITKLKRQLGKDIGISGSGTLVRSLLQDDLLDELQLMVHSVVLGSGKRLFEDGGDRKALELVDSKTLSTGVLYLTYQPAQSWNH
jgi:dihydrofolate reductase